MTSRPGLPGNGPAIESLTPVRVGVDVAGHRAEFLYWGFYEPRPWRNYLHTHSFFEICYAYTGRGVFRSGGREYPVDAGTLFVARPGDVHEIVSSDDDPLCVHLWSYTLVPTPARRRGQAAGRELLDQFAAPGAPVVSRTAGPIPAVLNLLAGEAVAPGPAYGEVLSGLAGVLVVDTARAVVGESGPRPRPDPAAGSREEQAAARMVRYLQDNFDRAVAVRDVAAQVHLSERQVSRLFRAFTGTTIHAFLVRLRLEIAAQRLLERSAAEAASLAEIARACGYPDVRHFTTAFRRHWGVPPGVFRGGSGTAHLGGPGGGEPAAPT